MGGIAIVVTTAPRPRPTTLESLGSLRESGRFDDHVDVLSDDQDLDLRVDRLGNVSVTVNDPPLGGLANWWAALDVGIAAGAPWVMLLEDDVTWAKGSRRALARDLDMLTRSGVTDGRPGSLGLLSLYVHPSMARRLARRYGTMAPGTYDLDAGYGSMGSQAYVLPRAAAVRLAAGDRSWKRNKNRDQVACGRLKDGGLRTLYRVPSLVNHALGSRNSSLGQKRDQDTPYWTEEAL
jgi:hypothetical protein